MPEALLCLEPQKFNFPEVISDFLCVANTTRHFMLSFLKMIVSQTISLAWE